MKRFSQKIKIVFLSNILCITFHISTLALVEGKGNICWQIYLVFVSFCYCAKVGEWLIQLRISIVSTNVVEWKVNMILLSQLISNFLHLPTILNHNSPIYHVKCVINFINELRNRKVCKPVSLTHFDRCSSTLLSLQNMS